MRKFNPGHPGSVSPALGADAVAPSDSVDLPEQGRALTLGGGGVVTYDYNGETYTTGTLPTGTYPLFVDRVRATGTTATDITVWY